MQPRQACATPIPPFPLWPSHLAPKAIYSTWPGAKPLPVAGNRVLNPHDECRCARSLSDLNLDLSWPDTAYPADIRDVDACVPRKHGLEEMLEVCPGAGGSRCFRSDSPSHADSDNRYTIGECLPFVNFSEKNNHTTDLRHSPVGYEWGAASLAYQRAPNKPGSVPVAAWPTFSKKPEWRGVVTKRTVLEDDVGVWP
jgi:hypothetical protein